MPLGNRSEAIMYHILKESSERKKKVHGWDDSDLIILTFRQLRSRHKVENTPVSKPKGIEGTPQLWTLLELEVRISNKTSGLC